MSPADWIAAAVLFLHLPIPLYWFVLHSAKNFWSARKAAAYSTGLALSWLPVTAVLAIWHRHIFHGAHPRAWQWTIGLALIVFEVWLFWRVKRDLGGTRLVGATELAGGGELETRGVYSRIRHPRYTGSLLALLGACTLASTRMMWAALAVWILLTRIAIALEEKELRARFGPAYKEYCRRIPAFFPWRRGASEKRL